MTFTKLEQLVRLANLEHKSNEIMKVKLESLVLAVEDGRDTINRLEAELKAVKLCNGSLTTQLHRAVMQDKGVYLESLG